jgi:YesN/AraC family two-component response regulator
MTRLVLLVDDNHLMRKALRFLFEWEPNFQVTGEANHGQEAIEKAQALRPHLIILDYSMPVMNGLEASYWKPMPALLGFMQLFARLKVQHT